MKKAYLAFLLINIMFAAVIVTANTPKARKAENTNSFYHTNKIIATEPPVIEMEELVKDPLILAGFEWYDLPEYAPYHGTKTWENYTAISNRASKHYQLQQFCTTDEYGFRKLEDRYVVAIGTYFHAPVGAYIDILLENGTEIPAIVGDIKSDAHTDATNTYTIHTSCATEFICDKSITRYCRGDISDVFPEWESKATSIKVYDYNYFTR